MIRNLAFVITLAMACAGFTPAQAAPPVPRTGTFPATGTVGNKCDFPSASLAALVRSNGTYALSITNGALTVKLLCNYATTVSVQLKATSLHTSTAAVAGETQAVNYTATATPWSTNPFVTTNDVLNGPGTAIYSGIARTSAGPVSTTLTIGIATFTYPTGSTKSVKNANYTSTITVALSASP